MSLQAPGTVNGWVRRCRKEGSEGERKKKSNPNNFHPVGAKMQITDQRGLEWKLARLGGNIIKLGLYMYVQDARQTCWTRVMELTCTWTLPPTPPSPTATIISLPAFCSDYSMYSTPESNLLSLYSTFLSVLFLSSSFYEGFSWAGEGAVYTDTNLLSKRWRIPLLRVACMLTLNWCLAARQRPVCTSPRAAWPFFVRPRCLDTQSGLMSGRNFKQLQDSNQRVKNFASFKWFKCSSDFYSGDKCTLPEQSWKRWISTYGLNRPYSAHLPHAQMNENMHAWKRV